MLKRYNDAIEALRESLRINPKSVNSWFVLGITYVSSGNTTAALDTVRELRRLDSTKADELFDLIVPR